MEVNKNNKSVHVFAIEMTGVTLLGYNPLFTSCVLGANILLGHVTPSLSCLVSHPALYFTPLSYIVPCVLLHQLLWKLVLSLSEWDTTVIYIVFTKNVLLRHFWEYSLLYHNTEICFLCLLLCGTPSKLMTVVIKAFTNIMPQLCCNIWRNRF